jgi:hypothetical protein
LPGLSGALLSSGSSWTPYCAPEVAVTDRPDLTEWHRYRARVLSDPAAMMRGRTVTEHGGPMTDWDAAVLVSLAPMLDMVRTDVRRVVDRGSGSLDDLTSAVLVVPAEGWRAPGAVEGATVYGVRVQLSDRAAWPALQVELSRAG